MNEYIDRNLSEILFELENSRSIVEKHITENVKLYFNQFKDENKNLYAIPSNPDNKSENKYKNELKEHINRNLPKYDIESIIFSLLDEREHLKKIIKETYVENLMITQKLLDDIIDKKEFAYENAIKYMNETNRPYFSHKEKEDDRLHDKYYVTVNNPL